MFWITNIRLSEVTMLKTCFFLTSETTLCCFHQIYEIGHWPSDPWIVLILDYFQFILLLFVQELLASVWFPLSRPCWPIKERLEGRRHFYFTTPEAKYFHVFRKILSFCIHFGYFAGGCFGEGIHNWKCWVQKWLIHSLFEMPRV